MPYPRKLLNEGETVELDLRPHWWFLVPRTGVLILAIMRGEMHFLKARLLKRDRPIRRT